jgi:DNA-binding NarL/FixJ family response regulator
MDTLRVLVADDHDVVRLGLVSIIMAHPGWAVCGEATNGRVAVEKAKVLKPDVVIIDIGMPTLNGLEATRQILLHNPRVKVLILTIEEADLAIRTALDAGAHGFLLKSDVARDLVSAVEALQFNNIFFTARVAEIVLSGYFGNAQLTKKTGMTLPNLTSREQEVIQLLAEGKSTKDVACLLDLSLKTAETHRGNLMRKLNLHSLSELTLFAIRNGIIQVPTNAIDSSAQGGGLGPVAA